METYGTTVTEDRYEGIYSGGKWLAFPDDIDPFGSDAFAGDVQAQNFWEDREHSRKIGRGITPTEAYLDMIRRSR